MNLSIELFREQLNKSLKSANTERISVLRMLIAAFKNAQIEKGDDLVVDEVLEVVSRAAKTRRESVEAFEKGGRDDLASKERNELKIIEEFLPEKLSDDELEVLINNVIKEIGPDKGLGPIMGRVMSQVKGRADGANIRRIVEGLLSDDS